MERKGYEALKVAFLLVVGLAITITTIPAKTTRKRNVSGCLLEGVGQTGWAGRLPVEGTVFIRSSCKHFFLVLTGFLNRRRRQATASRSGPT